MSLDDAISKLHRQEDWKNHQTRHSAVLRTVQAEEQRKFLRVGDVAPEFSVIDSNMQEVSLTALLERGSLVLSFYRGLWCSHCQNDLRGVAQIAPHVRDAGATVIAIGHGVEREIRGKFREAYGNDVPLFDDIDGKVAEQFGIRWSPKEEQLIAEELGTNIVTLRGSEPWIAPIQARFVIASTRTVTFSQAVFDFDQESHPSAVLPVLAR